MLRPGLLLIALLPPTIELAFAPREGSRVRQSYSETTEWNLQSLTQWLDGGELPMDAVSGMAAITKCELVLLDHYRVMDGARPTGLARTVERAESESAMAVVTPMGSLEVVIDSASELVDEQIEFEWDAERSVWGVETESGRSPRGLQSARVEAGLQELVGSGGRELGERWRVEADDFVEALLAGGDPALVPDSVPTLPGDGISGQDLLAASAVRLVRQWDSAEGEVRLRWEETLEREGRELARVTLEGELELAADLAEELEWMLGEAGVDTDGREDFRAAISWDLAVEGVLYWDLGEMRFAALEVEAVGEAGIALAWLDPAGEVEIEGILATETTLGFEAAQQDS